MKRVSSGLSPVIAVDRKAAKPLHKQVYDAFRAMIVTRTLGAGQQIPSTRALAFELKVSRIPVLTAYAQLLAEGYFEARVGAGTFVCSSLPEQQTFPEAGSSQSHPVRSGPRHIAKRALLLPPLPRQPCRPHGLRRHVFGPRYPWRIRRVGPALSPTSPM